jgi:tetratricopeptide (TPR) repeat protein
MEERGANTMAKATLLMAATVVVYAPAMSAGFIWDDPQLLTRNPLIRDPAGIWKVWFVPAVTDYFPVTASVWWLEFRLGNFFNWWNVDYLLQHAGATVNGYHVVNILLHGIAAVLTWRVLRTLRVPGAWVAGLIFAVHPVCAESVAWVSELKNTLSQVLFLLTLLAYLRFEAAGRWLTYIIALVFFCLSSFAKPSVVPLPAVLLLYAWWQRGAITRWDVIRSIPFFVVACLVGVMTAAVQAVYAIGAEVIPMGGAASRVANAGMAVWFYLWKLICPLNLSPIYPTWKITAPEWYEFLPGILFLAILVACWRWRVSAPARAVLAALGYYTIMLLPVLGFVSMSYMRLTLVADHFQYIAMMSIIALLVAAAVRWLPGWTWTPVAVVVLVTLSTLTWAQAAIYRDEETLWTETLKMNPDTWQGHNLLGVAQWKKGGANNTAAAFEHFRRAVELKPENPEAHNNLGLAYAARGQTDLAITEYKRAISIRDDAAIRTNLAVTLDRLQRYDEAEEHFRKALRMDLRNASRYANLGYVLMQQKRWDEATQLFRKALQLDPNQPEAKKNLALIMNQQAEHQSQER